MVSTVDPALSHCTVGSLFERPQAHISHALHPPELKFKSVPSTGTSRSSLGLLVSRFPPSPCPGALFCVACGAFSDYAALIDGDFLSSPMSHVVISTHLYTYWLNCIFYFELHLYNIGSLKIETALMILNCLPCLAWCKAQMNPGVSTIKGIFDII